MFKQRERHIANCEAAPHNWDKTFRKDFSQTFEGFRINCIISQSTFRKVFVHHCKIPLLFLYLISFHSYHCLACAKALNKISRRRYYYIINLNGNDVVLIDIFNQNKIFMGQQFISMQQQNATFYTL